MSVWRVNPLSLDSVLLLPPAPRPASVLPESMHVFQFVTASVGLVHCPPLKLSSCVFLCKFWLPLDSVHLALTLLHRVR